MHIVEVWLHQIRLLGSPAVSRFTRFPYAVEADLQRVAAWAYVACRLLSRGLGRPLLPLGTWEAGNVGDVQSDGVDGKVTSRMGVRVG